MPPAEDALRKAEVTMVKGHVQLGERHIARQHEIIAHLRLGGHPTDLAESVLECFEATLVSHRDHLARICDQAAERALRDALSPATG
jgi:hypothetical protein